MVYFLVVVGVCGVIVSLRFLFSRIAYRLHERREGKEFSYTDIPADELNTQNTLNRLNYFRQLSPAAKHEFIQRARRIAGRLQFSTAGNIQADDEKKILIVASIVQITFGLKDYDIDTIDKVKIFENNIYNPRTKVQYKGLTFANGNMYLSWEHFLEGIRCQDDGINLGLHETGHALYILVKQNTSGFDAVLSRWYELAHNEIVQKEDGKEFFRKYAGTNKEEFFAICIENFFERPAEFKIKLPGIYKQLSVFLNQDPSNVKQDYKLETVPVEKIAPADEKFHLHRNKWHFTYSLFIFLSYASIVVFVILKRYFLETFFDYVIFSVPCILLAYFSFKKFYLDSNRLSPRLYMLLCTTAISPVLVVLLMVLNLVVPVSSERTVKYKTEGYFPASAFTVSQNDFSILDRREDIYLLEDNYSVPIELRKADNPDVRKEIEYTYHYGLTGLKVYDGMKETQLK